MLAVIKFNDGTSSLPRRRSYSCNHKMKKLTRRFTYMQKTSHASLPCAELDRARFQIPKQVFHLICLVIVLARSDKCREICERFNFDFNFKRKLDKTECNSIIFYAKNAVPSVKYALIEYFAESCSTSRQRVLFKNKYF